MRATKKEQVYEACRSLESKNMAVTYVSVGNELGVLGYKRGSTSDIGRYLKDYRAEMNPKQNLAITNSYPSESQALNFIQTLKRDLETIYKAMEPNAAGGFCIPKSQLSLKNENPSTTVSKIISPVLDLENLLKNLSNIK